MFITFEGIDGSGKTTVLNEVKSYFQAQRQSVFVTREPGNSFFGDAVRRLLLDARNTSLCREAELFLYLADRAQHVKDVIQPALKRGEIVLCDRYIDSTIAYQGYGRGMEKRKLAWLNKMATAGVVPHLTFLFDLPVKVALERAVRRNNQNEQKMTEGRFENEKLAFHQRVRKGFLQLARKSPERFRVIVADQPFPDVMKEVLAVLEEKRRKSGDESNF